MGDMHHHIDGVHSLTGKVSEYASKAHSAIDTAQSQELTGGSLKDTVKTGATIARKALRTGAKIAEATALPATALGLSTGNALLTGYGEMAPMGAEAAELAAYGLGQMTKTL